MVSFVGCGGCVEKERQMTNEGRLRGFATKDKQAFLEPERVTFCALELQLSLTVMIWAKTNRLVGLQKTDIEAVFYWW